VGESLLYVVVVVVDDGKTRNSSE
jgi:hypothetical protein